MEIITKEDLKEFIRHIKMALGWTYKDMAQATGLNPHALENYGRGHFPKTQEKALDVVERIKRAAAEEQRRRRGLTA